MQTPSKPDLVRNDAVESTNNSADVSSLEKSGARSAANSNHSHALAIQLDDLSSQVIQLRNVWEMLTEGRARNVDAFATADRHYLVIELLPAAENGDHSQLSHAKSLQLYFLGTRQKVLAMELDRRHSTLTAGLNACLSAMGFDSRAAHSPALLPAAAIAAAGLSQVVHARLTPFVNGDKHLAAVSIPRLEGRHAQRFTAAELDIVRYLVDGTSYQQIAQKRKTSIRTVANQAASAFRKINVSGRIELLLKLASEPVSIAQQSKPSLNAISGSVLAPLCLSCSRP